VEWVGDAPASFNLNHNADGFWGGINDAQNGDTYVLRIVITVASTLPGVNITYMPYIGIGNQHTVDSSPSPVSGSSLPHTAGPGSWTWTADGDYLWNWNETTSRVVHLNGHVSGDANFVHANFDSAQEYSTDDDIVGNDSLDGYLQ